MNTKTHIFFVYPFLKICNYIKEPYEYKDTHFLCIPIFEKEPYEYKDTF